KSLGGGAWGKGSPLHSPAAAEAEQPGCSLLHFASSQQQHSASCRSNTAGARKAERAGATSLRFPPQ
ncbi:hypothetical protein KIL84_017641, partial [Mauremys mutica]